MPEKEVNQITKQFEYNLWANTTLLKTCMQLTPDQLDVTAVGVVDKIQPTLAHLVRAEGYYIKHLTGSLPWEGEITWEELSFAGLLEIAQMTGSRLIEVATAADRSVRHEVNIEGNVHVFYNWGVILQALYHGIEHRTHTKILLTNLGVDHPELASWDYMDSLM